MTTLDFPLAAGSYRFRPLVLATSHLRGWDVVAVQRMLRRLGYTLTVDGFYGRQTLAAVKSFQLREHLVAASDPVLGTCGPRTQQHGCSMLAAVHDGYLPPKLAEGVCRGESGLIPGEYTAPYRNGSRDGGLTEENGQPTNVWCRGVFDPGAQLDRLAKKLRSRHDAVFGSSEFTRTHEGAWRYGAVLFHNWQAASAHYVAGDIDAWHYEAYDSVSGTKKTYRMRDRAQWVVNLGVAGVETGYAWAEFYIATKVSAVTAWGD